jgi:glycosyltransferase involved in cell wall biosynthesis
MCNAFAENGHSVTLCVTDRKTNIVDDPETYFGVPFKFLVKRIAVPDIAGRAPFIPPFFRPFLFTIQRMVFAWRARSFLKDGAWDLVYGRDEWILFLLSFLSSHPRIWESHEAKFSFVARRLISRIERLVVISEGIQAYYVKHGVAKKCILVAHDAVDARFFLPHVSGVEARRTLGITTRKPVVLYIGGLEAWKGVETLFRVSEKSGIFEIYIIGGKETELERLRRQFPKVHFIGPRPYKELPLNQQAADILVIPNTAKVALSAEYTSPLKLFTYMTAKKPIVASRIPSITNVLDDSEAFFFKADDPDSLCDTIESTLREYEDATVRALRAHEKSMRYTWKSRAEMILKSF